MLLPRRMQHQPQPQTPIQTADQVAPSAEEQQQPGSVSEPRLAHASLNPSSELPAMAAIADAPPARAASEPPLPMNRPEQAVAPPQNPLMPPEHNPQRDGARKPAPSPATAVTETRRHRDAGQDAAPSVRSWRTIGHIACLRARRDTAAVNPIASGPFVNLAVRLPGCSTTRLPLRPHKRTSLKPPCIRSRQRRRSGRVSSCTTWRERPVKSRRRAWLSGCCIRISNSSAVQPSGPFRRRRPSATIMPRTRMPRRASPTCCAARESNSRFRTSGEATSKPARGTLEVSVNR